MVPSPTPRRATAPRLASAVLAGNLFVQLVCLGANGPLLATLAATLNILVAIVVIVLLEPGTRFWRAALPLVAVLLLLIGWAAIPGMRFNFLADMIGSRFAPDLFLPGIARLIGGVALFMTAGIVGYRRQLMRHTVDLVIAFGACQILIGLTLRGIDPDHVWGFAKTITLNRFSGTMINVNANACVAAATALLALGRSQALSREGIAATFLAGLARVGCVLTVVAAFGTCIISGSRMALVLTIIGISLVLALDPATRQRGLSRTGLIAFSIGATMIGVALSMIGGTTTIDRFTTLGQDSVDRVQIWHHYWQVARNAPLFGYGLASFSETNVATLTTPADAFAFWYINSAHNQVLQLIIEGGWIYLGLIIAAGAIAFFPIVRHAFRRNDPLVRAVFGAILLIITCSMVDIALDVPAVAALLLSLAGLLWGWALRASERDEKRT